MTVAQADPDRLRHLAIALGEAVTAAASTAAAAAHLSDDLGPILAVDPVARWGEAWAASLAERAELLETMAPVTGMVVDAAGLVVLAAAADHALTTPTSLSWEALDRAVDAASGALDWMIAHAPAPVAAGFLAGLDPPVATALARRRPSVGALPGAPLAVTFAANQRRIEVAIDDVDRRLAAAGPDDVLRLAAERELLLGMLHRRFVVFDWAGDGRLAEWVGPLDADNVAVLVPGMGTDKLDADLLRATAERLLRADATGRSAVVTGLVYDPPDGADVALPSAAEDGTSGIAALVHRLPVDDRHLVLVGHSYGSLVLGRALASGLAADLPADHDVVVCGSPGLGVDDVAELGLDPHRVWAAAADLDHVVVGVGVAGAAWSSLVHRPFGLLGVIGHGADVSAGLPFFGTPPSEPGFGAQLLDAGSGGHSSYLDSRVEWATDGRHVRAVEVPSPGLLAIAAVINGTVRHPAPKRRTPPSRAGKTFPRG